MLAKSYDAHEYHTVDVVEAASVNINSSTVESCV